MSVRTPPQAMSHRRSAASRDLSKEGSTTDGWRYEDLFLTCSPSLKITSLLLEGLPLLHWLKLGPLSIFGSLMAVMYEHSGQSE